MSKRQENIKKLILILKQREGISNRKIAEKVGLSPQRFHYHLNQSEELKYEIYEAILKELDRFGITLKDIEETKEPDKHIFNNSIPVYDYPLLSEVYAGEPDRIDVEYSGVYESFAYHKKNHNCFALKVNGKSMETTLKDGDVVLVDMNLTPVDGDLVAVKLKNGHQYIKRFKNLNYAFIQLSSDNSEYGVRLIDKNDVDAIYPVVQIVLNIRNGERKA